MPADQMPGTFERPEQIVVLEKTGPGGCKDYHINGG